MKKNKKNNAIISYDELIRNKDKININYDDEYSNPIPELEVRKRYLSVKIKKRKILLKCQN
ncbi:MAG: hypothetical protein L6V78_00810 [Clostridium sp.]|nr:MAG: hypothetical protein L6V78_00810 [Clostridium sp.]